MGIDAGRVAVGGEAGGAGDGARRARTGSLEAAVGVLPLLVAGLVLGPAVGRALLDVDDILLLSSLRLDGPLRGLAGEWGLGNGYYRPLHALTLWPLEALAPGEPGPQQALNLLLHLGNGALLGLLLRRCGTPPLRRGLLVTVALLAPAVLSGATWVSDRPTLVVTAAALGLLLVGSRSGSFAPTAPAVLGFGGLALLAKESGIVVLLAVGAWAVLRRRHDVVVAAGALVAGYLVLRTALLPGPSVSESGYHRGGRQPYDRLADLDRAEQVLALAENLVKGLVQLLLPVFSESGRLTVNTVTEHPALLLAGALVVAALALGRGVGPPGVRTVALLLVAANALVHVSVFRTRTLYVGHIALAVVVGLTEARPRLGRRALPALPFRVLLATGLVVLALASASHARRVVGDLERDPTPAQVERHVRQAGDQYPDRPLDPDLVVELRRDAGAGAEP